MSEVMPPYLKLHVEDDYRLQLEANLPGYLQISKAFENISGWNLAYHETESSRVSRIGSFGTKLPMYGRLVLDDISDSVADRKSRDDADELVSAFNQVVEELDQQRDLNWKLNAELAASIPVVHRNDSKLAKLLNSLLLTAANHVDCSHAALYILDDATKYLTQRSSVGFSPVDMLKEPRQLATAKADLEALMGHAVVIEDADELENWNIPHQCQSAVCIPVSSATTPLGTLWVFSNHEREFDGNQTNVLEIISGRIAAELEKEAVIREIQNGGDSSIDMKQLRNSLLARIPNVKPPIDELDIDGKIVDGDASVGVFYDWTICQDGRVAFCFGRGAGDPLRSAGVATILQTAFRAHCNDAKSAIELFDQIYETTQAVGPGEYPATLLCGMIDPNTGKCEISGLDLQSIFLVDRFGKSVSIIDVQSEFDGEYGVAASLTIGLQEHQSMLVSHDEVTRIPAALGKIETIVEQLGTDVTCERLLDAVADIHVAEHSENGRASMIGLAIGRR